jgi:hypothetical protein
MVACYLDYVRSLPASYYDVYVLSEFEGLSIEEIAPRLSLSPGAAKIRLHRARTRLNAELRRNCRCYYNERGELMGAPMSRKAKNGVTRQGAAKTSAQASRASARPARRLDNGAGTRAGRPDRE